MQNSDGMVFKTNSLLTQSTEEEAVSSSSASVDKKAEPANNR